MFSLLGNDPFLLREKVPLSSMGVTGCLFMTLGLVLDALDIDLWWCSSFVLKLTASLLGVL
jgi:hypothetical protein